MEIELRDINDKVVFPEEIKVIKEVTNEPEYKNSYLAKHKPE
jgi:CYTH domain-containing protein